MLSMILYLQLHKKNNFLLMVYPHTVFTGILNPEPFYNVHVYIFLTLNSLLKCPNAHLKLITLHFSLAALPADPLHH